MRGRGARRRGRPSVAGLTLRSQFEADVYADALRRGILVEYETERLTYVTAHVYRPDFILPNGIIVEAKGYFPQADRAKMLAVREANPDLDIRLLFQKAGTPIRRGSRTTYGQWATQHEFIWTEGTIPRYWAEETKP
jgi:hypothetical protein